MKYARPNQLEDALGLLANDHWSILAGGTDYFPTLRDQPSTGNVLDLTQLGELSHITNADGFLRIGALVTWTDLIKATLPPALDGLKQSAREIGSVQIQNRATLVGNLCNASPAADGVPPLLTLDASIELASQRGKRQLPLSEFIQGSRQTDRHSDELVTAILIPQACLLGVSAFSKLGFRKYLVISVSMVAIRLVSDSHDAVHEACISVGSCSAVAQRLNQLEQALVGQPLTESLADQVLAQHLTGLSPIDDVRAGKAYRIEATLALVKQLLEQTRRLMR
ncbi:MAG: xanthine dehydrogenase family protein subunit M [Burkholderiaceae bacterium]